MGRTIVTHAGRTGFGIDFGTTNSIVARCDWPSRETTVFKDVDTGLPHPSVVWYRLGEPPRCGREAKTHIASYAAVAGNVFVQSVKRDLGQERRDFDVFGQKRSPEEVAADVFRYLVRYADEKYGTKVGEAVLTVPVYFDGRARRALRKAADRAGVYIKTFLHEPFAALIGYVCQGTDTHRLQDMAGNNIVVFDWGGGTLDITVGRIENQRIVELATGGLADRAGDHFDEIVGILGKRKFQQRNQIPPEQLVLRPDTKDRYRTECERCKITLSNKPEDKLQLAELIRLFDRPLDLDEVLRRAEFEEAIRPIVDDAVQQVDKALDKARLTPRQVDLVLLIGGSSRIPLVQQQLGDRFGHTVVNVENADSIIAEGAAIADAMGCLPAFAASVAIELSDGTCHEVFKAGESAIPARCHRSLNLFCTDNRDGVARLIVGLGDGVNGAFERKRIITLPVSSQLPKPYNHERIEAEFEVDQDLVLNVRAKAATQEQSVEDELVDLRFAVSFGEV